MRAETPATRKRRRESAVFEAHLSQLPSANMYEQSLMHRDVVTHVAVTPRTDFAITASADGHVKFWKKLATGIEFVKHFVAHSAPVNALAVSLDGLRAATTSEDNTLKIFSVATFDMVNIIELPFTPTCAAWIFRPGSAECVLAVAEKTSGVIHAYNTDASGNHAEAEVSRVALHKHPVVAMAYSPTADVVVSADVRGMVEYWCATAEPSDVGAGGSGTASDDEGDDAVPRRVLGVHQAPVAPTVTFRFKMDTALYDLVKAKTRPMSIAFDPAGKRFVIAATDGHVRVFELRTGRLTHEYDESLAVVEAAQASGVLDLEEMDWSKRSAVEREMLALQSDQERTFPPRPPCSNAIFDKSGKFILFATLVGVKMLHLDSNLTGRVIGKVENTERFLAIALFQGVARNSSQMLGSHAESIMKKARSTDGGDVTGGSDFASQADPTLFCCAFKKHRFYLFSQREPDEEEAGRDVFNEKPTANSRLMLADARSNALAKSAIIRTTVGDIHIDLYGDKCPRTVENFTCVARGGEEEGGGQPLHSSSTFSFSFLSSLTSYTLPLLLLHSFPLYLTFLPFTSAGFTHETRTMKGQSSTASSRSSCCRWATRSGMGREGSRSGAASLRMRSTNRFATIAPSP